MRALQYCSNFALRSRALPVAVLVGLFVGGCELPKTSLDLDPVAQGGEESGLLGRAWSSPAGRLGVVPIAPPSEDVRVGDMFVYSFNPDLEALQSEHAAGRALSLSPRWGTLNLLDQLEEEYQLRPAWPKTPDAYLQIAEDPGTRAWPEAIEDEGESIFSQDRANRRLRNLGISEFSTYTLIEGDVNALIPTEAINLVLGSAWNDDKILSIRLSSAETYSLGLNKILSAALGEGGNEFVLRSPYRDHLHLIADPASKSVWMRVLSDVVYVRSIDIIIQSNAGFDEDEAARADEFLLEGESDDIDVVIDEVVIVDENENDSGEAEAESRQDADVVIEVEVQDDAELPDHVLDPAYTAFVRARAINELLIESDADDLPGGFMRFVSITDDSVTVRRFWQRGLAIGARGLTLEVDKITGEVLRSSQMGTMAP